MTTRQVDFDHLAETLRTSLQFVSDHALAAKGDSLGLLRRLPSSSISLVVTDPPYHATKKRNIYGDTAFKQDEHYLDWIREYAAEWRRVLRPNGSLYCFCASSMSARLEVLLSTHFNILSHVVWTKPNDPGFDGWKGKMKKESLRQWYPHSERIIFAEPALDGNLHRSPFAHFLRETRKQADLTAHQLTEMTGSYGRVNHGGAVSNWETGRNIPSRKQYAKLCAAIIGTGRVRSMPTYEDAVRVFRVDASMEFTDVWTFPSVRPHNGKHPAEKPAALLEHMIEASSFEGDIVLDCFAGSGGTAVAALNLGRRALVMEIEPMWSALVARRLRAFDKFEAKSADHARSDTLPEQPRRRRAAQSSLFAVGK